MESLNPADVARIATETSLPVEQIEAAVSLLNSDNTIPFITRYRRDETGGMDEPQLRKIQQRLAQLSSLRERKATILKSIGSQTELDEGLKSRIENCYSAKHLEDLYLPYKQKKTSLARQARDLGLQPLAEAVLLEGLSQEDFSNEVAMATNPDGEPIDQDTVIRGVRCLLSESFAENIDLRNRLRRVSWKTGEIISAKTPSPSPTEDAIKDEGTNDGSDQLSEVVKVVEEVILGEQENVDSSNESVTSESDQSVERNQDATENKDATQTQSSLESNDLAAADESVQSKAVHCQTVPSQAQPAESLTEVNSEPETSHDSESTSNDSNTGESTSESSDAPKKKKKRKRKKKRREDERFKDYFDYTESIRTIPPHRILAINRGEKEKKLRVRVSLPEERLWEIAEDYLIPANHAQRDLLLDAAKETLSRSLIPALEREIRRELTDRAEEHAIEVFTTNLRSLLLQPPIQGYRVLALDPGFKSGCKAAVLDELGNFVESTTVSIVGNKQKREASLQKLADLVRQHNLNLIAIGNGTGCRETELLVSKMLTGPLADLELRYVIVNEAGASIYSTSEIGREEFPDVDPTIRSAISIGRRVLDPLSELVKINPAHIGVGLYQHDVKSRHLEESLDAIVESCVNYVGVDANTASPALLRYVAGLSHSTAKKICEHRQSHGPFTNRESLLEVAGIGTATYVQCAGFLRVNSSEQPLDGTAIHPESYEVVQAVLDQIEYSVSDLKQLAKEQPQSPETQQALAQKLKQIDVDQLADQLSIGPLRMQDILDVLCRPGRDPRESVPAPVFRSGVLDIEDLSLGMHLRGQVLNVVDFGIFVDIGLGESGLVHISNLSTGFIRDPHQFFSVGDVLDVWVKSIDKKLKRVSLTAIDPESEPATASTSQPSKENAREKHPAGRQRRSSTSGSNSQRPANSRNNTSRHDSGSADKKRGGRRPSQKNQAQSGRSRHRRSDRKPKKPIAPISNEMAAGKEPMRSFSDLMQFVTINNDSPKDKKR